MAVGDGGGSNNKGQGCGDGGNMAVGSAGDDIQCLWVVLTNLDPF